MPFNKNKKQIYEKVQRDFKIPQFDNSTQGLMTSKRKFAQSQIASPIFGTQVKDELFVHDQKGTTDVKVKYENFRPKEEKKLTEEELIQRFGTKYYEFNTVNNDFKRKFYGYDLPQRQEEIKPVKTEVKSTFSFISDKKSFLSRNISERNKSQYENDNMNNDNIGLNNVTRNVLDQFEEFEVNSFESKNEFKNGFVKQNNALPSFLQSNTQEQTRPSFANKDNNINDNIIEKDFSSYTNTSSRNNDLETVYEYQYNKPQSIQKIESVPAPIQETSNSFIPSTPSNNQPTPIQNHVVEKPATSPTPKALLASDNLYRNYILPSRELFQKSSGNAFKDHAWAEERKQLINNFLNSFNIGGQVVNYTMGPTLSRFEIALNANESVKKIPSNRDTIQTHLAARTLRILAPIPGKSTVGLELPNEKPENVYFGDVINDEFYQSESLLNVALGKDIDGQAIYTQIDSMPHGLIAGSTGAGKSVSINTILISLLLKNTPDDLRLILIDPKQVELISYEDLPHLITPVIGDAQMASEALKWAVEEMDRRYLVLKDARVRGIKEYNKKVLEDHSMKKMPYIVVVIDELADLMMTCSSEVEDSIQRLAQKSRAAGIHLLVATQRPTVEVIKGNIKANIPTRIAFKVVTGTDSQTILDENGAEELLGRGDMLIKQNDIPHRLQSAYISDDETNKVTDFIRNQAASNYLFTHEHLKEKVQTSNFSGSGINSESSQTLYSVAKFYLEETSPSINKIQQYFNIGFNRAQKIVQALEEMEVIGFKQGSKTKEAIVTLEELNALFGK